MEENLDKNNEVNKEISDNTTKSNSEEIKGPKSDKVINTDINNGDSATKVVIKNEILINLPILISWRVHLKYLNEVF